MGETDSETHKKESQQKKQTKKMKSFDELAQDAGLKSASVALLAEQD